MKHSNTTLSGILVLVSLLMAAGLLQAQSLAADEKQGAGPKPINLNAIQEAIGYPEEAKILKIYGYVIARIRVDSTGRPLDHILLYSCHPILGQAVEAQIPNLIFAPAQEKGRNIVSLATLPFTFNLGGSNPRAFREPAGKGFLLFRGEERTFINNPFGKTYDRLLRKVGREELNGRKVSGQVFFQMAYDAQGQLKICQAVTSSSPELKNLVKEQIKHLKIDPASGLTSPEGAFWIFVPFSFH